MAQIDAAGGAPGATMTRGYLESKKIPGISPATQAGSGQATDAWLSAIDNSGIANVYERMDRSRLPQVAAALNTEDAAQAAARGVPLRDDLMKLRTLIAQGGPSAVRDYVKRYGSAGLPAAFGLGLLGYGLPDDPQGWQ